MFANWMLGMSRDRLPVIELVQSVDRFAGFEATAVQPDSMATSAPPIADETAS